MWYAGIYLLNDYDSYNRRGRRHKYTVIISYYVMCAAVQSTVKYDEINAYLYYNMRFQNYGQSHNAFCVHQTVQYYNVQKAISVYCMAILYAARDD